VPKISPLAPTTPPHMPAIAGARLGAWASGGRYSGRSDLMLAAFDSGTTVAGVLTRSLTASAPVDWCRHALAGGTARGLVVNSGNANAFTGKAGIDAVAETVDTAAALLGCARREILVSSTGVIGEPLTIEKIVGALPGLYAAIADGHDAWDAAANAIKTTDTFAKLATRTATIDGRTVTLNGIAKGSGMIAPDMATMLAYVVTDAQLPAALLQALLKPSVEKSFNAITVDSDTSTSDTVLLFATGKIAVSNPQPAIGDRRLRAFRAALDDLCRDLAHQIVRDGEGASKFITIDVCGAASRRAARRIGLAIANSPLVKTAIAGGDPNWGRIVMAVGKAGEKADRDALRIWIGETLVTEGGMVSPAYDEAPVAEYMKGSEISLAVDVGVGRGRATVWTCDLTHGYIEINADYRS
jgi:glutamate N-acetyltransferase/amino-acid N-acetyltransferase